MLLKDNPRYLQEKKTFQERINKMPDGDAKLKSTNLLRQLEGEVQELDRWHEQLLMNSETAKKFNQDDTRDIISSIRKQIEDLTKNF
jgi:hypothetical protein|tara:strand:+ start:3387 stop:3647 length:261 start_codon:yes stop_codon:yes gene_type:complete